MILAKQGLILKCLLGSSQALQNYKIKGCTHVKMTKVGIQIPHAWREGIKLIYKPHVLEVVYIFRPK